MPVNNLIQKFETLHQLSQELIPREEAVLRYLCSAPKDIDNTRIEGLLTLVKSITSLRQLAHLQLREAMLEMQGSIRLAQPPPGPSKIAGHPVPPQSAEPSILTDPADPSSSLDQNGKTQLAEVEELPVEMPISGLMTDHPDANQHIKSQDPENLHNDLKSSESSESSEQADKDESSDREEAVKSPKYEDEFDMPTRIELPPHIEFGPFDETPPVFDPTPIDDLVSNEFDSKHESDSDVPNADEELAALEREIDSITQPIFGYSTPEGGSQTPPVSSLLPPSLIPSDETPLAEDVVLRPDLISIPNDPFAEEKIDQRHESQNGLEQPQNQEPQTDFSSVFPESAGQAGTATFDAKSLNPIGIFLTPEPEEVSQVKANFYAQVSTPDQSFEGLVHALSEHEIFIKSREPLQRGEEVQLSFTLPSSREQISCKALVREVRTPEEASRNQLVPGVSLRFLNLRSTQETLIGEEVKRQTLS